MYLPNFVLPLYRGQRSHDMCGHTQRNGHLDQDQSQSFNVCINFSNGGKSTAGLTMLTTHTHTEPISFIVPSLTHSAGTKKKKKKKSP